MHNMPSIAEVAYDKNEFLKKKLKSLSDVNMIMLTISAVPLAILILEAFLGRYSSIILVAFVIGIAFSQIISTLVNLFGIKSIEKSIDKTTIGENHG